MKKEVVKILLTLGGAVLFNLVFWQEKAAINMVLFDLFILWSVLPVPFCINKARHPLVIAGPFTYAAGGIAAQHATQ